MTKRSKVHDNYKLWSPQPDPATIAPCPICNSGAEVWQFSESPDSQLQRVVMCTNGEPIGPQVTDGMTLLGGCLLYMPPDDFYRARTIEAVRYWNDFAKAITALRSGSTPVSEIEPCSIEGMISSHRRLQGAQEGMAAGIELAARYCETCKVYSTVGQYYAKQLHTLKNAAPQGNEREGAQSKAVAVQPQLGPQSPDLAGSTPDAPAVAAPKDTTAGSSARQPEALQAQGDDTTVRGVAPAAGVPLDKPLSVHDHGNCELCDQLESELVQAMRALNAAGEAIEHLESLTASARDIGLPRGWSLRREGDGIVVSHEQEGAVFVREDTSRSLAECILFYLADDLMDPALPRRYTRTDSTGQKP